MYDGRKLNLESRSKWRSGGAQIWRMAASGLALMAVAIVGFGAAPSFSAAAPSRFTYEVCDTALPGGSVPATTFIGAGGPFTPFQECGTGGLVGIRETGSGWGQFGILMVPVPATAGGYVESMAMTGFACWMGPTNTHPHIYEDGWPAPICRDTLRYFHVHDGPNPYAPGTGVNVALNCDGVYDGGGNHINCQPGPTIGAQLHRGHRRSTRTPPGLSDVAGSLLAGGQIRGHQEISAKATDKGGGLSQLFVLVNGIRAGATLAQPCSSTEVPTPASTER